MPENRTPTAPPPQTLPPGRTSPPAGGKVFNPNGLKRLTIGTVGYMLHGSIIPVQSVDLTKWDNVFGNVAPRGEIIPFPGPREIAARQLHIPAGHYIGLEFDVPLDPAKMGYGLHMYANNIEFSASGLCLAIAGTAGDFNGLAKAINLSNNDQPVLYHRLEKPGRTKNPYILDVQLGAKLVLNIASNDTSKEGVYVLDAWTGLNV